MGSSETSAGLKAASALVRTGSIARRRRGILRVPERLSSQDVLDFQLRKEAAKIFRALLHTGLLGDLVSQKNKSFRSSLGAGIARVLDCLPLGGFSRDENLHIVTTEHLNLLLQSGSAGTESHVRDGERRISHDTERLNVELRLKLASELRQRCLRNGQEERVVCFGIALPAQSFYEAYGNVIGRAWRGWRREGERRPCDAAG